MAVINCVCGYRLEAADGDALFAAIRAHSNDAHADLQISDVAIGEMVDAAGLTARWDGSITPIECEPEIRKLTPALVDDFLTFFDRDAFMDNPIWASCYCLFYQFAGTADEWERRSGAENRRDKADLVRRGEAQGYLAYVDGRPAAWCHAAPRATLPGLDRSEELRTADDVSRIGSIVCFVVAAPYRKQGLAARLLDAACDGLREQGAEIAEAYPARVPESDAQAYHGPLKMYEAAGFTPHRDAGHFVIVHNTL